MNERTNERMTFLDDGGEGDSYSSKPSFSAQHQPYTEEGSVLQILSVVPVYNHYKHIYFESSRKGNVKQSNSGHGYFFFFFLFLRGLDIT
jgi:hypothetical protein